MNYIISSDNAKRNSAEKVTKETMKQICLTSQNVEWQLENIVALTKELVPLPKTAHDFYGPLAEADYPSLELLWETYPYLVEKENDSLVPLHEFKSDTKYQAIALFKSRPKQLHYTKNTQNSTFFEIDNSK